MARRYDSRTTIFSPEGRLFQVEYAMEAIAHASTIVGILAPGKLGLGVSDNDNSTPKEGDAMEVDESHVPLAGSSKVPSEQAAKKAKDDLKKYIGAGVVLAAEKKVTSKLLEKDAKGTGEKVYLINSNLLTAVAGLTADANSVVSYARTACQQHLSAYDEDMPIEQLVKKVCDLKQGYTQFGGLRPFGVSFLYAGHDPHHSFQLYASDPSGNYSGWKATCLGANNSTAQSLLRQDYKDDISLDEAMGLALRVLSKTMDSTSIDSEKLEFATLTVDPETGLPHAKIFKPAEVDELLKKHGLAKKEEDNTSPS